MRREGWMLGLFLLLTVVVGWGVIMAQLPLCRHECFDANQSGHCNDFVLGAVPPCMGTELCMSQDGARVAGWVHVKVGQCTHSGQSRDQYVYTHFFDGNWDGKVDYACKGYHSCPKAHPHWGSTPPDEV